MDRTGVGRRLHADVVHRGGSAAPIENSPPGIQTIPSGGVPGAIVALAWVGAKVAGVAAAFAAGADAIRCSTARGLKYSRQPARLASAATTSAIVQVVRGRRTSEARTLSLRLVAGIVPRAVYLL